MCASKFTLGAHISVAAFPEFESPEIVFFAERILARPTRYFPSEAPIAIIAQSAGTSVGL